MQRLNACPVAIPIKFVGYSRKISTKILRNPYQKIKCAASTPGAGFVFRINEKNKKIRKFFAPS